MTRKRSFARGPGSYRRGVPRFLPSGHAFLIVTEGLKTEPNYLKALCNCLRLAPADVDIDHPEGTDPITLTRRAINLRDARKIDAKKGFLIPYDEVWVVFDLEKPHDERRKLAKEAMALKEAKGLYFAISDPCFEFWLLLHEKLTTHLFLDSNEVEKEFRGFWKDYTKSWSPPIKFIEKLPVAVKNAEYCRNYHKSSDGDGNPSTGVDKLVRSLNSATRLYRQFTLD